MMDHICIKCGLKFEMTDSQIRKHYYVCKSCQKEKFTLEKKELYLKNKRIRYLINPTPINKRNRKNYFKNKEKWQSYYKEIYNKDKDKLKSYSKKKQKNDVLDLSDCYVRRCLKRTHGFTPTQEMIEQKKIQIKILRQIKTIKTQLK